MKGIYLLFVIFVIWNLKKKIVGLIYEYDLFLSDNDNKFSNYSSSNWKKNSSNAYDIDDNYLNDSDNDNIMIILMVTKLMTIE